ncbi:MAG: phospho-N-acetylmuramoyl-pentapeptide-transferase [Alphaproteobacteria bacterium]|nr:phospho-N-acetylmuramoyl-pentapeptide-transferase [Alphaproteobacteria bacterium]
MIDNASSIITRSLLTFFISFGIVLCFGTKFIKYLSTKQSGGQPIREDGPQSHIDNKQGTPTMGGILIILSVLFSLLLFGNLSNISLILSLIVLIGFSIIGFIDDYKKVSKHDYHGISAKLKMLLQIIISTVCCLVLCQYTDCNNTVYLPFFKDLFIDLGYLFIPWAVFVIIGSSNAINITDGLDGLVIVPVIITSICLLIISYTQSEQQELCILLSALIGSGLGFLWFNAHPAKIFMGDVGAISIGALLGFISVILKQESTYAIIGGVFVMETMSDIIQVLYYKRTNKRIFLMAPLHHHFEKKGLSETTIVIRFWIVSFLLAIIGLTQYFICH